MKATLTDKRPCRLARGEIRRVPQDRCYSGLVGYHVCCPRCGFVTAVLNGTDGVAITESDEGAVSFSHPPRCVYCSVLLGLTDGAFALEEDEHVRSVRYR